MNIQSLFEELKRVGTLSADAENVSEEAIDQYISDNTGDHTVLGWTTWPIERRTNAALQIVCINYFKENNVDVKVGKADGLIGPNSKHAFSVYDRMKIGLPQNDGTRDVNMATKRVINGVYYVNDELRAKIPLQADCMEYYGNIGTGLTSFKLPFPLRLSWETNKRVNSFEVHTKALEDFQIIFDTIRAAYSLDEISDLGIDLWGGTYNPRKMRGGSAWSMHSWAIAIDFDPDRNSLNTPWSAANFRKPEYVPFVNAFLARGWVSLGLEHNFDAMHFQRARVK